MRKLLHNAKAYAKAMVSLAKDGQELERLLAEFELVLKIEEQEGSCKPFLELDFFRPDKKIQLLVNVFEGKVSPIFLNLLKTLATKGHFSLLPRIYEEFKKRADRLLGNMDATATTVVPLSPDAMKEITSLLEKRFSMKVNLHNEIDPEIIGGIVLQAGEFWVDNSVRHKLRTLKFGFLKLARQMGKSS